MMTRISDETLRQQGFTLLELMVVVSLIALGIALVVPNLSSTKNSAFNAQVREANGTLGYARRMAVVRGTPAMAEFLSSEFEDDREEIPDSNEDARRSLWSSEDISLSFQDEFQPEPEPVDRLQMIFYPQGGSTGGTLYFAVEGRQAVIRVNPITGRISTAYNGEELDDAF